MDLQLLGYGMAAAWLALALYAVSMTARARRLAREIEGLRGMVEGDRIAPRTAGKLEKG